MSAMHLDQEPTRALLRELLEDTDVTVGGKPAWARDITLTINNTGEILTSREQTTRFGKNIALIEEPAPLSEEQRLLLSTLAQQSAAILSRELPAQAYELHFSVGALEAHLDSTRLLNKEPNALENNTHKIHGAIHSNSFAQIQELSIENCPSCTALVYNGLQVEEGAELISFTHQANSRDQCLFELREQLERIILHGPIHNTFALIHLLSDDNFLKGQVYPHQLAAHTEAHMHIIQAGMQSTIQDSPGRIGFWEIGVPPSGPMDDLGLRLANICVGNSKDAAGIEITLGGFSAEFSEETLIALGGPQTNATCNGEVIPLLTPFLVPAKTRISIPPSAKGLRSYLAVRGGINCARYLGSCSTFTLGGFGGHQGRELQNGDLLFIRPDTNCDHPHEIPKAQHPRIGHEWHIGVRIGPHTSPDFITEEGIREFFSSTWTVSPQSNRTGIRLDGPTPKWARKDGGEAGLHPSNLHDNAYAFGAIDLTGDMPVVLGPDGPSLGGFVCPGIVVSGQRWKLGQLRPGDKVRWSILDEESAKNLREHPEQTPSDSSIDSPIILQRAKRAEHPGRCIRRQGDEFMLIEFGAMELELGLRLRVQSLYEKLQAADIKGIIDLVPGIRSLQVHFDPDLINEKKLSALLEEFDDESNDHGDVTLSSRHVHMPLSWDDPSTRKAIEIYMQTVNPDAPWCPWNIEFIRRINGLDSIDDVYRIVFDANYLVYGLGDVYLGAPVATPIDPRHRLVTTKYNPARTWTPENAVGIGGAYMCIYGMEGPGGYQFVGRTVQVWNPYPQAACFEDGKPWLLRQFDRIDYYPVSADELLTLREGFPAGRWQPKIEQGQISLAEELEFARLNAEDIAQHKQRQQHAFQEERQRWAANKKE